MSNPHKKSNKGFAKFKEIKKQKLSIDDENSAVIEEFRQYAKELDDKHDRYERIVKLSRDITIESKRIIFLLHTVDLRKNNKEKVLQEAFKRLQTLCTTNFLAISKELDGCDPYQYGRAYSAGLQEFIEAYTFYEYINKVDKISDWDDIQNKLKYEISNQLPQKDESTSVVEKISEDVGIPEKEDSDKTEGDLSSISNLCIEESEQQKKVVSCLVQPSEFLAGLADVGGEIMRRCVNSIGSGDIDTCFETCKSLQDLFTGYLKVNTFRNRDLSRKIYTLKQSVMKTENVCYNITVRGSEVVAKWSSLNLTTDITGEKQHFDEDEGFF